MQNSLKDNFIEQSLIYGSGIENGDDVKSNEAHEKLSTLYGEIKLSGSWEILVELSESSDDRIKYCASVFLLGHKPMAGLEKLKELEVSRTIIGFSATTTIDMWNKGIMNL